jgi:hypothetical protein
VRQERFLSQSLVLIQEMSVSDGSGYVEIPTTFEVHQPSLFNCQKRIFSSDVGGWLIENNVQLRSAPIHPTEMKISSLPFDLWYEVFGLLDIDEAIAVSKANPRLFGAFIVSKQGIRFRNAINSYMRSNAEDLPVGRLSSYVCSVSRNSQAFSLGSPVDSTQSCLRVLLRISSSLMIFLRLLL